MAQYKLTLTADLSSTAGPIGFFNGFVTGGQNRTWMLYDASKNPPWQPAHDGDYGKSNSDTWGPTLNISRATPTNADTVQFQVYFSTVPSGYTIDPSDTTKTLIAVTLYVIFGRQGRTNAANTVASPFVSGNSARCILTYSNSSGGGLTSPDSGASLCSGAATPGINPAVNGNRTLKFDFSIAAAATWGTTTYQYGYDPELDLDISA